MKSLEDLDLSQLTAEQLKEVEDIMKQIELRKKEYPLLDVKLQPHQQEFLEAVAERNEDWTPRYKIFVFLGWNGSGKCWAPWTPILMHDWTIKNVEDIKKGDKVMWPDSKERTVLSLASWEEEMFEIKSEREEDSFTVNKSHILPLVQRRRDRKGNRKQNSNPVAPEWELVSLSIEQYLKKSDRWKTEAKLWRPNVVNFTKSKKELPVDPYFLWLWLWDWTSINTQITTADEEIWVYLYSFAESLWMKITRWDRGNIWYKITNWLHTKNQLLNSMREIDVIGNKHIPFIYKTSSYEDRMQILAWLIDSDWYRDGWDWYVITQKRKEIIDDIKFIASSLWFKTKSWNRISKMKRTDWTVYKTKVYTVYIQWRNACSIPLKIERKKTERLNFTTDPLVSWFKIESKWVWTYYWFEIDWDHLLLDWNFIVHHNTFTNMYITMLMALGKKLCRSYRLPEIGDAHLISINTTTWSNISKNLDKKYLLWTWTAEDVMKFPWYVDKDNRGEVVKTVRWDKNILKDIELKRGASISFWTYDQWQARLQWSEPIWTSMDELPTRFEDLLEIVRGNRNRMGQVFISATPTNYNKKIHDYLFNDEMADTVFLRQVDSFENEHADHSWMKGMTEEDIKIRRFGSFTPPEWLVYPNFSREANVIEHLNPKMLGSKVRFYWAVDFGFNHPTAFLFIAVDNDWHFYIFDMIYKSKILMSDLAKQIKEKQVKYWIEFDYIVADSAGAQERHELKAEGFNTKGINKNAKVNDTSFRAWGILKVNQLFDKGSIIISDKCKPLIDELEVHHFKENWDVDKHDDDAIDSLRYMITEYTAHSEKRALKKTRKRIAKKAQKSRKY